MQYGDIIVGSQLVDATHFLLIAGGVWILCHAVAMLSHARTARLMTKAARGR